MKLRLVMPRTRMRRVKNLALAGAFTALTAMFALLSLSVSTGWMQVASWSASALAVLSVIAEVAGRVAAVTELKAGGRRGGWRGKGSGLSGSRWNQSPHPYQWQMAPTSSR